MDKDDNDPAAYPLPISLPISFPKLNYTLHFVRFVVSNVAYFIFEKVLKIHNNDESPQLSNKAAAIFLAE